jgi:hypothetical protein
MLIGNKGNIARFLYRKGSRRTLPPPGTLATPVDMFWSGEGVGLSVPVLDAQTFGGDGGTWSIDGGSVITAGSASSQMSLLRNPISVLGVQYTGSGIGGFAVDLNGSAFSACRYAFGTARDQVLIGFFFKVTIALNFTNYDFVNLEGSTGTRFAVFGGRNNGTPFFYVHTDLGVGPTFNVVDDTLYWVQLKYDRNVAGSVAVWRVSDWTLIGSSTLGFGGSEACGRIIAPHFNGHGATQVGFARSDNYITDYTSPGAYNSLMV